MESQSVFQAETQVENFSIESPPCSNEGPMKRPRGDKFETRVLVPSKVAGSVIGKGGSNIQKLRTDNNANIRIPDCPGPERIMTVLTSDSDTAVKGWSEFNVTL